ncbi:hypothetical protein ACJZ2D_006346 [Fusarium nematophilum]
MLRRSSGQSGTIGHPLHRDVGRRVNPVGFLTLPTSSQASTLVSTLSLNQSIAMSPEPGDREADERGDERDGEKRGQEIVVGGTDASEPPPKKARRGRYISRACISCQQRKIKCDAGDPCAQCIAKKRTCVSSRRPPEQQVQHYAETEAASSFTGSVDSPVNLLVLARLAEVERQLQMMRASTPYPAVERGQRGPPRHVSADGQPKRPSAELQNTLETDGQTFAGELSMTPAMEDEYEPLDRTNTTSSGMLLEYPSPGSSLHHPTTRRVGSWLEGILAQHGVAADEQQWRCDLQTFLDEVHPFYACLHPPKVWETFNDIWEYSALWSVTDAAGREHKRISLALVFFCLAVGRCSMSSNMPDENGVYSSGWSLYSVGMTLLQGRMETGGMTTKSLLMLQTLLVRVVYLFRLDANQQAARILALIVSMAHTIGMHRQATTDAIPAFHNQLYCRTWWAIYTLDRRIAIESGKPYLIRDCNVDTALPIDLSDEWMTRFATRTETVADLQHEIAAELARDRPPSPVPYTVAMARYSRVAGKAWDVLYGVKTPSTSMSPIVEHLDTVLSKLLDTAPKELVHHLGTPGEAQARTSPRWQVKQGLILFTCCTYLRLLIRRPYLGGSRVANRTDDEFEPATASASLAARILTTHQNIKDDGLKYCFALSHYITSCTMVMLGLVSREPGFKRRYGDLVHSATRSLNVYCQRNWVSGKMKRLVSRLSQLVQRTLGADSRLGHSPTDFRTESQLSPHTEDQGPRQLQQNAGNLVLDVNDLSMERRGQWSDGLSYGNTIAAGTETQSASSETNAYDSWMAGPSAGIQNDWIMSDLDFKTIVGDDGRFGESVDFSISDESVGTAQGGNIIGNRNCGESKLSALGLNGVVDLDMDADLSIMNLWDTSPMLDLDMLG